MVFVCFCCFCLFVVVVFFLGGGGGGVARAMLISHFCIAFPTPTLSNKFQINKFINQPHSPEISPEAPGNMKLEFAVHEVTEDGLDLHQHFLVYVLTVRV